MLCPWSCGMRWSHPYQAQASEESKERRSMAKTLKCIAFFLTGGAMLATGGCTLTDLLSEILPGILPA